MKRRVIIVALLVVAGAVVNVAVAWGCALRIELSRGPFSERGASWAVLGATGSRGFEDHEWEAFWKVRSRVASPHQRGSTGYENRLSGRTVRIYSGFFPAERSSTSSAYENVQVIQQRCGLPMRSLMHEITSINYRHWLDWPTARPQWERLPTMPLWPGFAVNTVFYAAILWLPFGPFLLRRAFRRRKGLCLSCGYPMGEASVCTECGKPLPGRMEAMP